MLKPFLLGTTNPVRTADRRDLLIDAGAIVGLDALVREQPDDALVLVLLSGGTSALVRAGPLRAFFEIKPLKTRRAGEPA